MLIPFKNIADKHKHQIKGIIHIGANTGQELDAYIEAGIKNIVFIEPIPEVFKELKKNVLSYVHDQVSGVRLIQELIGDVPKEKEDEGVEVDFFITDNDGESSSYLPMKLHKEMHPDVKVVKTIKLKKRSFDWVVKFYHIDLKNYNFLNMDIQGVEFFAMLGMKKSMPFFDFIYTEVNEKEIYEGNVLLPKMNAYLEMNGFSQKELNMTPNGWGDAFYVRNTPFQHGSTSAHQNSGALLANRNEPLATSDSRLETNSSRAAKEISDILNDLKVQLVREVSGSTSEHILKGIEPRLRAIVSRYVKE